METEEQDKNKVREPLREETGRWGVHQMYAHQIPGYIFFAGALWSNPQKD